MPTSPFRNNIENINVPILSGLGESGIVLTNQTDAVSNVPSIMFALETACNRFGASAVYFVTIQTGRHISRKCISLTLLISSFLLVTEKKYIRKCGTGAKFLLI